MPTIMEVLVIMALSPRARLGKMGRGKNGKGKKKMGLLVGIIDLVI